MLAIFLYILPVTGALATARWWILMIAVALTVLTGIDYVVRAIKLRKTSERTAMKKARRAARG